MSEKIKQYDDLGRVIRANRTQLKLARAEISSFCEVLLRLPTHQYELLPIDETLHAALIEGKRLQGNAYKRHLNFLTRLLAAQDIDAIRKAHLHINHAYIQDNTKHHQVRKEIAALLTDSSTALPALIARYDDLDIQYVRQLVREAQKLALRTAASPTSPSTELPYSSSNRYTRRLQRYLASRPLKYQPDD